MVIAVLQPTFFCLPGFDVSARFGMHVGALPQRRVGSVPFGRNPLVRMNNTAKSDWRPAHGARDRLRKNCPRKVRGNQTPARSI
jgi:hypothetical protein